MVVEATSATLRKRRRFLLDAISGSWSSAAAQRVCPVLRSSVALPQTSWRRGDNDDRDGLYFPAFRSEKQRNAADAAKNRNYWGPNMAGGRNTRKGGRGGNGGKGGKGRKGGGFHPRDHLLKFKPPLRDVHRCVPPPKLEGAGRRKRSLYSTAKSHINVVKGSYQYFHYCSGGAE